MILPARPKRLPASSIRSLMRSTSDNHLVQVFIGFGRQAHHHVKLNGQHAAIEYRAADVDDFVVGQVLVDDATQAIGSGFGRDGDLLIARFNQRVQQFVGNLIQTQGRN